MDTLTERNILSSIRAVNVELVGVLEDVSLSIRRRKIHEDGRAGWDVIPANGGVNCG